MKNKILFFQLATMFVLAILASGCKKDENNIVIVPELSTLAVTGISISNAQSGGVISTDGGATIINCGVCWNTSGNPTIADSKTTDVTGLTNFTSNITNLTPNTNYYVRAYATNEVGTGYGDEITFNTNSLSVGQNYAGGKVFYIDGTGKHGLAADFDDYGSSTAEYTWQLANILCLDMDHNSNSDWRLPTKDELNLLRQNKNAIGGFVNANYWSSTYCDYYFEPRYYYQNFTNGYQGYMGQSNEAHVRAIRTF